MQIESSIIKEALYKKKQELQVLLDRSRLPKVKSRLEDRLSIVDYLFMWINDYEKKGGDTMDAPKLGELTKWEPKPKSGTVDASIIEDSKKLTKNYDAIKVTAKTIKWSTLYNRTYALRTENKIDEHVFPRKDENGVPHLVYIQDYKKRKSRGN